MDGCGYGCGAMVVLITGAVVDGDSVEGVVDLGVIVEVDLVVIGFSVVVEDVEIVEELLVSGFACSRNKSLTFLPTLGKPISF